MMVDNEGITPEDPPKEKKTEEDEVPYSISIVNQRRNSKVPVPLWLVTFTDVMALMLTFFVLLYAMSVPQEKKWEEISNALSGRFSSDHAKPFNPGSQDVISIDKIDKSRALDLTYLKTIVKNLLKENGIENVVLFQNGKRLIISLPSELLFGNGRSNINFEGKKVLFHLGGALSRVKNRIEIAGHTDPNPIQKGRGVVYQTNWELSLARSASVAAMLKEVGYSREMIIRGLSSARFDELPESVAEDKRFGLSRRVDIILMDDDGLREKFYSIQ